MGINLNTINMSALNITAAPSARKGVSENIPVSDNPVRTSDMDQSADRKQDQTEKVQKPKGYRNFSIAFSTYGTNNEKISVTITDKDTGKVIREIPPEEIQQLSAKLDEVAGMFIDDIM